MLSSYLQKKLQWDASGRALHRSVSLGFGALLGILLLPGFGVPLAALAGAIGAKVLGALVASDAESGWRRWLDENLKSTFIGVAVAGAFIWPASGPFQAAFGALLTLCVALSILGIGKHLFSERSEGLIFGLLICGAYGSLLMALGGAVIGAVLGVVLGSRTPLMRGAVIAGLAGSSLMPSNSRNLT